MAYTVEKIETNNKWLAVMAFTVPDMSSEIDAKAMRSLRAELKRIGAKLATPEYNYVIAYDDDESIEVVDMKLYVSVEGPVSLEGTSTIVEFEEEDDDFDLIRIHADNFEDVHIGLADWMHENDYVAAGELRRVLTEDIHSNVFDSPVRKADD